MISEAPPAIYSMFAHLRAVVVGTVVFSDLPLPSASSYSTPAIHAVIKHANVPAINARNTCFANTLLLQGASELIPPSCTPIEPKFAKPHKA